MVKTMRGARVATAGTEVESCRAETSHDLRVVSEVEHHHCHCFPGLSACNINVQPSKVGLRYLNVQSHHLHRLRMRALRA